MTRSVIPFHSAELPPKLAQFRRKYREHEIGRCYSGFAHLSYVLVGSAAVIALAISFVKWPISAVEWLIFLGTFVTANFVEYFGHRLPMHNRIFGGMIPWGTMFHRHTGQHHQFFTESCMTCKSSRDFKIVLFPPIMLFVYFGCVAMPFGLAFYFLCSQNAAMLCVIMSMIYFLQYETLHFCYHLDEGVWIARLPVMRQLREHHRVHHAQHLMNSHNFNITWPIADFVFGTIFRGDVVPAEGANEVVERKAAA